MREGNGSAFQDKQTIGLNRNGLAKLPEGWEWACIGDLALGDIQTGPFGAQLHRSEFVSSGVPVLAIGNVKWGYVDLSEIEHVTPEKAEQLQRYVLRAADVLFTRSGTVGRSAVLPKEADGYLMTGHILRIRLNPEIYLPALLFRAFRGEPTMDRQLQGHTRGMTRAGFNTSLLSNLVVPVPPPAEQRRIVAKIEVLQERSRRAREALSEVGSLLEQFRQSVLAAAFRGDLTADWRAAHPNVEPASELLQRIHAKRHRRWEQSELAKYEAKGQKPPKNWQDKYKEPEPVDDSALSELPEGWCWIRLPSLGYMNRGKSRYRPRNAAHLYGGPYPFVQTGDIAQSRGRIISHKQTYSEAGLAQSKLWSAGTVCVTIAANIASSAVLSYPACFPDSIVGLIPDESLCTPEFVEFFIRTAKGDLERFAPSTAQKNINLETLTEVAVPLPPLEESKEITRLLTELIDGAFHIQETVATSLDEQIGHFDQSILAKAFRGELVPQDPNDEPVSALLARIREQRAQQVEAARHNKKASQSPRRNKTGKQSPRLTPQQLTLAEVL